MMIYFSILFSEYHILAFSCRSVIQFELIYLLSKDLMAFLKVWLYRELAFGITSCPMEHLHSALESLSLSTFWFPIPAFCSCTSHHGSSQGVWLKHLSDCHSVGDPDKVPCFCLLYNLILGVVDIRGVIQQMGNSFSLSPIK